MQVPVKVELPRVGRVDLGEEALQLEFGRLGAQRAEEDDLRAVSWPRKEGGAGKRRVSARGAGAARAQRGHAPSQRDVSASALAERRACAHQVFRLDGPDVVLIKQVKAVADFGELRLVELALLSVVPPFRQRVEGEGRGWKGGGGRGGRGS